ncbi:MULTISPECIES: helix-turn-helix domain-containing protein [Streptomyces]|uniref:helix-turn-helix domain-containing protein n=1 Tax=Streptomyces TaxID=1883 RepID=UPI00186B4419|nr:MULTISPECIES: hypothetical protein [Streptomyces]
MTTATRPAPAHGTTARAKGRPAAGVRGCGCEPCMAAARRYDGWRRLRNLSPDTALTVPAGPVAEHLHRLRTAGAGWRQLQAATGCSSSTISAILNGELAWVRRDTARRITALQPGDAVPGRRLVDATGTRRRLRALAAIGHTITAISGYSGVDAGLLQELTAGRRPHVSRDVAGRVATAYREMATSPGGNQRAINRAQRGSWPNPEFWEDWGGIDDPQAPECEPAASEQPRYAVIAENAMWLEQQGHSRQQAAERLGVSRDYVNQAIRRLGQRRQNGEAS